jgi:hypothetical protein
VAPSGSTERIDTADFDPRSQTPALPEHTASYICRIVHLAGEARTAAFCLYSTVDKTDISLILGAFSALAVLLGAIAALIIAAFLAGLLLGQHRRQPP